LVIWKSITNAILKIGEVNCTEFEQIIKMRATAAERRMKSIKTILKSERSELEAADYALANRSLQRLSQVQKHVKTSFH